MQFEPSGSEYGEVACSSALLVVPQLSPPHTFARLAGFFPAHLSGEPPVDAHYPTTKTQFLHTSLAVSLPKELFCTLREPDAADHPLRMRRRGGKVDS